MSSARKGQVLVRIALIHEDILTMECSTYACLVTSLLAEGAVSIGFHYDYDFSTHPIILKIDSIGALALLHLSPAMKGKKALSERALSLNLIDKPDTGSGSKHCHRVYVPYLPVTEDGVDHRQFGTFGRTCGDTNGH